MKLFHRIPGAKFYMPDGREIAFAGGSFDTDTIKDKETREAVEKEMKKIANFPASQIYTHEPIADQAEGAVNAEVMATATSAFDGDKKITGNPVTVAVPQPQAQKPVLNPEAASGKMSAAPATKAVADKLAAAKAAVAATAKPSGAAPINE